MDIIESEERKGKKLKQSHRCMEDLWDTIRHINIFIVGVPEEKKKRKVQRALGEMMAENSPYLKKDINRNNQEAQHNLTKMNFLFPSSVATLKTSIPPSR